MHEVLMLSYPKFKEVFVSKVNVKRQVTIPIDALLLAGIGPGDEVEIFFERHGVLSVVKEDVDSFDGFQREAQATTLAAVTFGQLSDD